MLRLAAWESPDKGGRALPVRWMSIAGVAAAAAAFASAVSAQKLPIEQIQLRGDRFHGLSYAEMTPEQRVMLDHTVNSARAVTNTTANGPFNVLLRSPEIGDLVQQLGNSIRFASGLTPAQRELATLAAGRAWTSRYEWYAHARYAADAGIPPAVVDAIAAGRPPDLAALSKDEGLAWRVAEELMFTRRLTDATYSEALAGLGEQRLASAAMLAAYYELVSMILNVDRYPLPSNAPPGAVDALAALPQSALYRVPSGPVTARRPLPETDYDRAIESLLARLRTDANLPDDARAAVSRAVMYQWNRVEHNAAQALSPIAGVAESFASELLATRAVSDAKFASARDTFGERRLVNLIVLIGASNLHCAKLALAGNACSLDDR
jgi:4-carboxymuconolactone decarboxylase